MDFNKLKAEILAELRKEFYLVPKKPVKPTKPTNIHPIRFSVKWSNGIDESELHVYGSEHEPEPESEQVSEPKSEQVLEPKSEQVLEPESEQVPEQKSEQVPEQKSEQVSEPESEKSYESDKSYESESDESEPKPIIKHKYTNSSNYKAMVENPEMLAIFKKWYEPNKSKYNALKHAFNSLIKHEGFIEISSDGIILSALRNKI